MHDHVTCTRTGGLIHIKPARPDRKRNRPMASDSIRHWTCGARMSFLMTDRDVVSVEIGTDLLVERADPGPFGIGS